MNMDSVRRSIHMLMIAVRLMITSFMFLIDAVIRGNTSFTMLQQVFVAANTVVTDVDHKRSTRVQDTLA